MFRRSLLMFGAAVATLATGALANNYLGLPPLPVPADNPITPAKVTLGDKLFHDVRFSSTGTVSCATCHDAQTGFTDGPRSVSEGIEGKTGTRNAPTVLNAAFNDSQFWDGRSPDLEDQSQHPFTNPVEMGLKDHQPIVDIVKSDPAYQKMFQEAFGVSSDQVTFAHVQKAIATFERTMVAGNSPFDQWFYGGKEDALTDQQKRGYELFIGKARCADCHTIEQTHASFTDGNFHNIGVGVNKIRDDVESLASAFLKAKRTTEEVDVEVLTNPKSSELGRFAVETNFDGLGAFKTPTLRNIELTAPYMHDGSIKTLEKVVEHYNNGGVTNPGDPVSDFLAGGIRPLNLEKQEQADLVAFMKALTSASIPKPQFAAAPAAPAKGKAKKNTSRKK